MRYIVEGVVLILAIVFVYPFLVAAGRKLGQKVPTPPTDEKPE